MSESSTVQGFRASPQQRRLALLWSEPALPRNAALAALRGELDVDRVRAAVARLTEHHEILRTRFARPGGLRVPVQTVLSVDEAAAQVVAGGRWPLPGEAGGADRIERFRAHLPPPDGGAAGLRVVHWEDGKRAGGPPRHLLLLDLPALCADRASLRTLVAQLGRLLRDPGADLGEVLQYVHYSEWQNELFGEGEGREHWASREPHPDPALHLPFAGEVTPGETPGLRSYSWSSPPEVAVRLRRLGEELGVSEEAVWLSAWTTLLSRLADRSTITVGCATDGRSYEEFEGAVGVYARYLPVHCRPESGRSFAALAREVHAQVLEGREWQDSFSRSAGGSDGHDRGAWELGFELTDPPERSATEEAGLELLDERVRIDRFDVHLTCRRRPGGMDLLLDLDGARYDREHAERLAAQLDTLTTSLARDGGAAELADLDVASPLDLAAAEELHPPDCDAEDSTPVALFRRQVARGLEAPAVEDEAGEVSYGELDRRAAHLARELRRHGVRAESVVGVCMEHTVDLVVAVVAVLRAGGAYLPIDPNHPDARTAAVLEDARPRLVLARGPSAARLRDLGAPVVEVDALPAETGAAGDELPEPDPASLCYLIYTSGSTGRPKGVAVPHRAVANYLRWCAESYFVGTGRRTPVHSPLGFDLTVTSLLGPLASGRTAVMIPEARGLEGLARELFSEEPASVVKITPAHLGVLLQMLPAGDGLKAPGALVVGGEALHGEMLEPWHARSETLRVVNEYGPTEATVGCSVHEVVIGVGGGAPPAGNVPIGRPIPNLRLHVVDERMRATPQGVAGELLVGGAGLARGYRGRARQTAGAFLPDPHAPAPGERLYRTGDRVRQRRDGALEFLGRIDDQIKLRGYRIEPGEIEARLRELPPVADCAVAVREDLPEGRALVAYVVREEGAEWRGVGDLRAALHRSLPDYMVPARFVVLDALPITVNGKVDRSALPAPPRSGSRELVRPATVEEMQLARIWEELLGREAVGVTEDFFEIGGHSLLAARMMAQVRRRLGRELPLMVLVTEGATIRVLARLLKSLREPGEWSPRVELQRGEPGRRPLFLLPPEGGHVLSYVDLVRRLDDGFPVYGLQAPGRDGGGEPLFDLGALAELFLRSIREVQPEGPYRLAGWSLGGVYAFEIARRLRTGGEEVELLALLDPDLRRRNRPRSDAEFLVDMVGQELSLTLEDLGEPEDLDDLLTVALERVRQSGRSLPEGFDLDYLRRLFMYYKVTYDARRTYVPRSCPGRAHYFMSRPKVDAGVADPTLSAKDLLAGGLDVYVLPAGHRQFVEEPNVRRVASILNGLLQPSVAEPAGAPAAGGPEGRRCTEERNVRCS